MRGNNASIRKDVVAQLKKSGLQKKPWCGYVAFKQNGQWASPYDTEPPLTMDEAADKLAEGIAKGWDCYLTLASFKPDAQGRARGDTPPVAYSRLVWADYDATDKHGKRNPVPFPIHLLNRDDDRCIPELADAVELVESGRPGHYQPRIHLRRAVRAGKLDRLNHAFKVLVGGDAKWPSNTYLRLPGSPNSREGATQAVIVQEAVTPLDGSADVVRLLSKAFAEVGREYDWDQPLKAASTRRAALTMEPISNARRREILRLLSKDPACRRFEMSAKLSTSNFVDGYDRDRSSLFAGLYKDLRRVGLTIEEAYAFLEPLSESFVDAHGRAKLERHIRSQWPRDEPDNPAQATRVNEGRPLRVESAVGIKPKRVKWLWHHRIPLGGLSLIGGREGTGKSTVVIDLMAKVTRGQLDGELYGKPRDVVYMTTEDSWESTIVPRLIAANANLGRVKRIRPAEDDEGLVNFADDLVGIKQEIAAHRVALIAVDPILSVLGDDVDDTKGKDLRRSLESVGRMASDTECAVLGVIHFNKRDSDDVGMLFSGNLVWSQVARATLAVVPHPDREGRKNCFILDRGKNNLAPPVPPLEGEIKSKFLPSDDGDIETSYIEGLIESEYSLRQAMRPDASSQKDDRLAEWIVNELEAKGGEAPKKDIVERAKEIHGASPSTVERRFKQLHGRSRQHGFGPDKAAYWSLPGFSPEVENL